MPCSMSTTARRGARWGAIVLIAAAAAGCAGAGKRVASVVTPYRIDVVQGNFISSEQVQALSPGMSQQQVREILGTPLMASLFHADRWEYVFTLKRPGVEAQTRRLTVFFKNGAMERVEGDTMPSEAEFVASLSSRLSKPKVPQLEATPEQLARFPKPEAQPAPPPAPQAKPATHYPPLEASGR